jgi:hypothetical protein
VDEPTSAATEAGTRKIPLPMIVPTTTAVVAQSPSRRGSWSLASSLTPRS